MTCCCIPSRSSWIAYTGAKYGSFNVIRACVIRQADTNPVVRRAFTTCGRSDSMANQLQSILRPNTHKEIQRSFPTKWIAKTYAVQDRSFISAKRRLSDSSSNDVSNEMKSEQTKVTILNDQTDSGRMYLPFIYTYSKAGFTIGKNKVIGSVALFPGGILSWKVASHYQITPESLAVFPLIYPKLELLILGVGDKVVQVPKSVWDFARMKNIALEVLDTPNACATYNFLTEEGRRTAAALIPPQTIKA